jgi:hypothetical protein
VPKLQSRPRPIISRIPCFDFRSPGCCCLDQLSVSARRVPVRRAGKATIWNTGEGYSCNKKIWIGAYKQLRRLEKVFFCVAALWEVSPAKTFVIIAPDDVPVMNTFAASPLYVATAYRTKDAIPNESPPELWVNVPVEWTSQHVVPGPGAEGYRTMKPCVSARAEYCVWVKYVGPLAPHS